MIKKIMDKIASRISFLSIRKKIVFYYLILLILSLSTSSLLYQRFYSSLLYNKVGEASFNTLHSVSATFNLMMETTRNYSEMLLSNDIVQQRLQDELPYRNYKDIETYLSQFALFSPLISSIYIYREDGNQYYIDSDSRKKLNAGDYHQEFWYKRMDQYQGMYSIILDASHIFHLSPEEKYLSLVRRINNINSMQPIGYQIINISHQTISNSFGSINGGLRGAIIIQDSQNSGVITINNRSDINPKMLEEVASYIKGKPFLDNKLGESSVKRRFDGKDYLISFMRDGGHDLTYTGITPFDEVSRGTVIFYTVTLAILFINTLFLLIGMLLISNFIVRPIHKLAQSMRTSQRGDYVKVNIRTHHDEIGVLCNHYNNMIDEINDLIHRIIEEQKVKRQAELNVLHAQIKPHFLYNSFDAVSSLALSDRKEDVYKMMKALGSYYRISLSKGREVISLANEIEIIKTYLIIQKYRYDDMFDVEYDIEDELLRRDVLKLILQPLVENALYHGIRNKNSSGTIRITVKSVESQNGYNPNMILIVEDDGIGMDANRVMSLQSQGLDPNEEGGFGLKSTMERLTIFYEQPNLLQINSIPGRGTKVTITIPGRGIHE